MFYVFRYLSFLGVGGGVDLGWGRWGGGAQIRGGRRGRLGRGKIGLGRGRRYFRGFRGCIL